MKSHLTVSHRPEKRPLPMHGVHRSDPALSRDPGSRVRLTVSQPMRPSPPGSGVPPSPPGAPARGGGTPDPSDPGEIPMPDTYPDPGSVMHRQTPCPMSRRFGNKRPRKSVAPEKSRVGGRRLTGRKVRDVSKLLTGRFKRKVRDVSLSVRKVIK